MGQVCSICSFLSRRGDAASTNQPLVELRNDPASGSNQGKSLRMTQHPSEPPCWGPQRPVPTKAQEPSRKIPDVVPTKAEDPSLGHERRGVTSRYLANHLLQEMVTAGLPRNSKVYEIEKGVILTKGVKVKCPRDGQMGAAYVDCIYGPENAAMSTHMLSYTWGYAVGDISDCIKAHCKSSGADPKKCYFWLCCLCINQHRVKAMAASGKSVPFSSFQAAFGDRVQNIGHVVAMMSPWAKPQYLTRVWCVFEMFTAISLSVQVSIVMPQREADDFHESLVSDSSNIDAVWESLAEMQVDEAEASVAEDKERIMQLISNGPGAAEINVAVVKFLQTWFVTTCEQKLRHLVKGADFNGEKAARDFNVVGSFFRDLALYDRAEHMFNTGRKMIPEEIMATSVTNASLLRGIGAVRIRLNDFDKALLALEEAKEILERTGTLKTLEGGRLFTTLGAVVQGKGDKKLALQYYTQAKDIFLQTRTLHTAEGSKVLMNVATLKRARGDAPEDVLKIYQQASDIRKKVCRVKRNTDISLIVNVGHVLSSMGEMEYAQKSFEEAWRICEHLGTTDTAAGIACLKGLGAALRDKGDLNGAIQFYEKICQAYLRTGTLDTPAAAEVLYKTGCLQAELGKMSVAAEVFEMTRSIYQKLGQSGSAEAKKVEAALKDAKACVKAQK